MHASGRQVRKHIVVVQETYVGRPILDIDPERLGFQMQHGLLMRLANQYEPESIKLCFELAEFSNRPLYVEKLHLLLGHHEPRLLHHDLRRPCFPRGDLAGRLCRLDRWVGLWGCWLRGHLCSFCHNCHNEVDVTLGRSENDWSRGNINAGHLLRCRLATIK
jgi:hypothetical protein